MKCFIVTEGKLDAVLLNYALSTSIAKDDFEVMSAGGQSAAVSLARSLLVTRSNPVAIVVDADSLVATEAETRRQHLTYEVEEVADLSRVKILVTIPEIEAVLFASEAAASQLTGRQVTREELTQMREHPKEAVGRLLAGRETRSIDVGQFADLLTRVDPTLLAAHPTLQSLTEFVARTLSFATGVGV